MQSRLLIIPAVFALVACGGGDSSSESPAPATPAPSAEAPAAEAPEEAPAEEAAEEAPAEEAASGALVPDDEGIIRLEANDMMKFNAERIEVTGTTIKLELKHVGSMAKEIMGHNVVILTPGTDALAWASVASGAQATEYVPEGDAAVIAASKLLGGGDSDMLEFEVPGPGEYPFVCSFPGHGAIMKGVLVVS